jgi:hypothetical protein
MVFEFGSNTKITSISGPCSLYLLMNKLGSNDGRMKFLLEKFSDKGKPFCFPMILLLGDYHTNLGFQCKSCKCCKTDDCCTKIYEDKFFLLLDNLAESTKASIKIFIESMLPIEQLELEGITEQQALYFQQSDDVGGIEKVKYSFEPCFSYKHKITSKLVEETKLKCKSKHLKWMFGDPRSIDYTNQHETLIYESVLSLSVQHIGFFALHLKKETLNLFEMFDLLNYLQNKLFPYIRDRRHVQILLYELFHHLELLYNIKKPKEYIDLLFDKTNEFSKLSYNMNKVTSNEDEWKAFILDYFNEIILEKALVQEINKTKPIHKSTEKENWTKFLNEIEYSCTFYSNVFGSIASFILKAMKTNARDLESMTFTIINPNSTLSVNQFSFMQTHTILTSFFVDINLFFQIVKNQTEDLVVAYVGQSHCKNLILALTEIFGYQRRIEKENRTEFLYDERIQKIVPQDLQFRCINLESEINDPVNLPSLISDHIRRRKNV